MSSISNGTWTEPTEYAKQLYSVDSISGTVIDGSLNIAYSVDMDGNLDDYSDKEVYLNNQRITDNATLDSKVKFDGDKLYWYSDGNINEYSLSEHTESSILSDDSKITTDRFDIISNNGNKAIVFGNAEGLATELYAYMYDSASNKWGKSIELTDLDSSINSFSGILSDSGNMKFIVNKTEITGNTENENSYGQTDLAMFIVSPSYNLSVDDAVFAEDTLVEGSTVEFNVDITNNGELTVDSYTVELQSNNGTILSSYDSLESILPGETKEIQLYYNIENEFQPQEAKIVVTPLFVEDFDNSDNTYSIKLTYEDMAVENMDYGILDDGNAVIYGDIVNRGYGKSDTITVSLHKDSIDGEIVDIQTISSEIETLDVSAFSFTIPYRDEQTYYVTIDADDMQSGNNSDFVVLYDENIMPKLDIKKEIVNNSLVFTITPVSGSVQRISDLRLYRAEYNSEGRLIDIEIGKNTLTNDSLTITADLPTSNNYKFMLWDSEQKPIINAITNIYE